MKDSSYHVPLALTIISGIFLALGAIFAIIVTADIIHRRGWRSMMSIMIPVYIINATYLGPIDLFIYYRFGRPAKPSGPNTPANNHSCHNEQNKEALSLASSMSASDEMEKPACYHGTPERTACHSKPADMTKECCTSTSEESSPPIPPKNTCCSKNNSQTHGDKAACHSKTDTKDDKSGRTCHNKTNTKDDKSGSTCHTKTNPKDLEAVPAPAHACHAAASARPYWATVLVGVSHCGAGCVLGDLVGEWLVYGTNASINGHGIWAELLIDYAFALLFGIFFQYFSIAPMSGEWGPMTVIRAAKADVLSLTSFEVGAFSWMIAYQVGIFGYRLSMDTWLYWWMMQIGMCLGVATAFPVNWWLLKAGIKEPCC